VLGHAGYFLLSLPEALCALFKTVWYEPPDEDDPPLELPPEELSKLEPLDLVPEPEPPDWPGWRIEASLGPCLVNANGSSTSSPPSFLWAWRVLYADKSTI